MMSPLLATQIKVTVAIQHTLTNSHRGSTYTGHYEPVEEISKILDEYEAETGIDIPIHVDGASGGFIAPFTHAKAGGAKWSVSVKIAAVQEQ
jgi:hypothetical protein